MKQKHTQKKLARETWKWITVTLEKSKDAQGRKKTKRNTHSFCYSEVLHCQQAC